MTSKLKCPVCPYCDKPLHCDGTQYINERIVEMWYCQNPECEETEDLIGTREMWEIVAKMIQAKQDLEQSEKCCSAWETQALDYKAETIALSGKLEIATKALEEIDTTRCIPQQTLISLGKFSKTTRFNAGNIICVATPDYIHNTLEQIEHKE